MKTLTITLDTHSYPIQIGTDLLSGIGAAVTAVGLSGHAAIVSNPTVAPLYAEAVASSLQMSGFKTTLIEIPDGEEFKTSATLNLVYDRLIEAGVDRKSFVVALGGGLSVIWPDLPLQPSCGVFRLCRCQQHCLPRLTAVLVVKQVLTTPLGRI